MVKILGKPMENEMKITIEFENLVVKADVEEVVITQTDPDTKKKSRVTMSFDEISEVSDVIGASVLANPDDDD